MKSKRNWLGAAFIFIGGSLLLLSIGNEDPVRLSLFGLAFVIGGLVIFATTGLLQKEYGSWMSHGPPPP
jgi:drug/metabolite transporter (DMT)-like permease